MPALFRKHSRISAHCDLGHTVEVMMADGVVSTIVHRDAELIVNPISGQAKQQKCPACMATAQRLLRSGNWT